MHHFSSFLAFATLASQTAALAIHSPKSDVVERSGYPFDHLVAFGDELSDNGNGSYAHGITGDPANVYGFGTWTNGPVAVQYLAGLLGLPLTDYAFGGCCGGGSFGATINNRYTPAAAQWNGKPVASVHDQVLNYTKTGSKGITSGLQFIWTGMNDLSEHTDAFWEGDPKNAAFAAEISKRIVNNAERLVKQGAPAVFVANIYPKHLAPVTKTYLCADGSCVDAWGKVITAANEAIKTALSKSKYADKFVYYDVFSFMVELMKDKNQYGLTQSLAGYCDGDAAVAKWDECAAGSYVWEGALKFYWMNFIQPTARVHQLIAQDMKKAVDVFFM